MTDRISHGWRRLLGLAAAPGRALSALEPALSWDERFSPELGLVETQAQALLTPLLSPALGEAVLERAVSQLTVDDGEAVLPVSAPSQAAEALPSQAAPRKRRAAAAVKKAVREKPALASSGVSPERLEQMASPTDARPSPRRKVRTAAAESPAAVVAPHRTWATPPRKDAAERPVDAVPSRARAKGASVSAVEASARLKQRAERAGASQALDTPVVLEEAAQALVSQPKSSAEGPRVASVAQRIDRALERLEPSQRPVARGPAPRARAAGNAEQGREAREERAREEKGREEGGATAKGGLAGLAARATGSSRQASEFGSQAASGPRPPQVSSSPALLPRVSQSGRPVPQGSATLPPSSIQPPPVPAVLAERMEELKLTQQLDRILRREAERAGINVEGLEP